MSVFENYVRAAFFGITAMLLTIGESHAVSISATPYLGGAAITDCSNFAPPDFSNCNPDGVGDLMFPGGSLVLTPQVESRNIAKFFMGNFTGAGITAASLTSATFRWTTHTAQPSGCGELRPCPMATSLAIGQFAATDGTYSLPEFAAGADFVALPIPGPGSSVEFDVTPFIGDLLTSGDPFAGFNIRLTSIGGIRWQQMHLIVSDEALAVPEVGTILLFGVGLLGLAAARRRTI